MNKVAFAAILTAVYLFVGAVDMNAYDIHHPDPMAVLNGHFHSRPRKAPKVEDKNTFLRGPHPELLYRRRKEAKYIIKDEPYSIASKKADPELLGPQRTYSADSNESSVEADKTVQKTDKETMSKDACISLIGEKKFNKYVEKYGSENSALKRCLILKRVKG